MKCQAVIEDHKNGTRYNLSRVISVPDVRPCSFSATCKIGPLHLCSRHGELAKEGMIDNNGRVPSRSEIEIARKYPKRFPHGLFSWARDFKLERLP